MMDLEKEIANLKSRLDNIEKTLPNKSNLFGKPLCELGKTSSEAVIATSGCIKVRYGNKYVTIFKDGKLVLESPVKLSVTDRPGNDNGIYVVSEEGNYNIYLVVDLIPYLISQSGTTYISYDVIQQSTALLKETALLNIGLVYKTLNSVNLDEPAANGFIYVLETQKFYIISEGVVREFLFDISEQIAKMVDLKLKSITLNNTSITESGIYCPFPFNINGVVFEQLLTIFKDIKCNSIKGSHFSLTDGSAESTLVIDNLRITKKGGMIPLFYPYEYILDSTITPTSEGYDYDLEVSGEYSNGDIYFAIVDSDYILFTVENSRFICKSEKQTEVPIGTPIYKIYTDGKYQPLIKIEDSIELLSINVILGEKFWDIELGQGSVIIGLTSDDQLGLMLNKTSEQVNFAKYSDASETIPIDTEDKTLVTAEWVKNIISNNLPIGTIIAYHGSDIPDLWHLCDGTNGTPNLTGKFLLGGTEEKEGNLLLIFLSNLTSGSNDQIVLIDPKYYSLIFIMKIK